MSAVTIVPPNLKKIEGAPSKLFILGEWPDFNSLWIAIVGTRKATREGQNIARRFAEELASIGAVIVSGLAFGIDAAAHEGALNANGKTVAVLGNGLNKIYPAQNQNLGNKIIKSGGALVSEYTDGTPSLPHQFLERNRIVSGLSDAVIVIEAPKKSGALATANHAAEQGREVFVIPGHINHVNFEGSHQLIRDGARLVTSAEQVLEDLGIDRIKSTKNISKTSLNSPEQSLIFEIISNHGKAITIDELINISKLESQVVNKEISFLLIKGIIKESEQGYTI